MGLERERGGGEAQRGGNFPQGILPADQFDGTALGRVDDELPAATPTVEVVENPLERRNKVFSARGGVPEQSIIFEAPRLIERGKRGRKSFVYRMKRMGLRPEP